MKFHNIYVILIVLIAIGITAFAPIDSIVLAIGIMLGYVMGRRMEFLEGRLDCIEHIREMLKTGVVHLPDEKSI